MKKFLFATTLLSFSSFSLAADVSAECQQYFNNVDTFLELASKNEAMKEQFETLKTQYEESKKHIAAAPKADQDQACKPANELLETVMEQLKATQK